MFRLLFTALLFLLSLGTAMAQNPHEEIDGLNAKQWAQKIVNTFPLPEAHAVESKTDKSHINQLIMEILFADLPPAVNMKRLVEYQALASEMDSDRHLTIIRMINDLTDNPDITPFMADEDWFVLMTATFIDLYIIEHKPGEFDKAARTFEYLMKGNRDDPIYPVAEYFVAETKRLGAYYKGDLNTYLEAFKKSYLLEATYLPDIDSTYIGYHDMSVIHWMLFDDPSVLDIFKLIGISPSNHEPSNRTFNYHYGLLELYYGDPKKAYEIFKSDYKKGIRSDLGLALAAAAVGKINETKSAVVKTDQTKLGLIQGAYYRAAKAILDFDDPSQKDIWNWINSTNDFRRVQTNYSYRLLNKLERKSLFSDNWFRNFDGSKSDINGLYYQGIPLSLETISKLENEHIDALKSIIGVVQLNQNKMAELTALQTLILEAMNLEIESKNLTNLASKKWEKYLNYKSLFELSVDELGVTGKPIKNPQESALRNLLLSIRSTHQGKFQTAWFAINDAENTNLRGTELEAVLKLHVKLQKARLLALEGNSRGVMQLSISIFNEKLLVELQTRDTVSLLINYLAQSLTSNDQLSSANEVIRLDPRLDDDPRSLPVSQLLLATWLQILTDNFNGAQKLMEIAEDKAARKEDILITQSLAYILHKRNGNDFKFDILKKSILGAVGNSKIDPKNIKYYLAYGDLLVADPSDEAAYRNFLKNWRDLAGDRVEAIQRIQSKIANNREYVDTQRYTHQIDTLKREVRDKENQFSVLGLISFSLLILVLAWGYLFYRNKELLNGALKEQERISQKNTVFAYYINNILTLSQKSGDHAIRALLSLERGIDDPKMLEFLNLATASVTNWSGELSSAVFTAKYLVSGKVDSVDNINFIQFLKDAKIRWQVVASEEDSTISISQSNIPAQLESNRLFLDMITDLVIGDALSRSAHNVVNVHLSQIHIQDRDILKISISDSGNKPDILSPDIIYNTGFEEDVLQRGMEEEKMTQTNIALRALDTFGGSFRQFVKTENSDNILELFIPVIRISNISLAVNNNELNADQNDASKR